VKLFVVKERPDAQPRTTSRILPRQLHRLQAPEVHRVPRRVAQEQRRQDPAARTAQLACNQILRLGDFDWQVITAPGHDPQAVMLFQPDSRVLISADALWEHGLAIIFPELYGAAGFTDAHHTLDRIQALAPRVVIPGHGPPFTGVAAAIQASRSRLAAFQREPQRHLAYAVRALVTFRLLDMRRCDRDQLLAWMLRTPIFVAMLAHGRAGESAESLAQQAIAGASCY
jgi:glyoxylase-like metal-dependent hydrolase (beta-lactamase superfamily II)